MKKLFIGLLIVAAGGAILFLRPQKQTPVTLNNFQQEQIIGKWKLDSLHFTNDSNGKLISRIMSSRRYFRRYF